MRIWEDVYSKLKGVGREAVEPLADQNQYQQQQYQGLSESLDEPARAADFGALGDLHSHHSHTGKPPSVNQADREGEAQAQAPIKQAKSRFIPRTPSGRPPVPYPPLLAKMRYSLADTWANIMLETKQKVQTVLVCGSARHEGTTLISFHLAMFLSKEYSMKVLYVDTNLNHAAIPKIQKLPGVYSFVSENKDLASLVVPTEYPGLYLLPSGAGSIARNVGSNMLSREPIEALLNFCRKNFDMTIIDGQPLVSSPVMIEFARVVDMTLLVCRYGYSRYEVSRLAVDKLQKFGISSIGVVFNDRKFPVPRKIYDLLG